LVNNLWWFKKQQPILGTGTARLKGVQIEWTLSFGPITPIFAFIFGKNRVNQRFKGTFICPI
jgi:hypothetical protein